VTHEVKILAYQTSVSNVASYFADNIYYAIS